MEPIEGCPACGALPIDWSGGANPHAFCADLKADNAALVELVERANVQVDLGKATGSHTGNRFNIYQIAEELVAALQATEPRP